MPVMELMDVAGSMSMSNSETEPSLTTSSETDVVTFFFHPLPSHPCRVEGRPLAQTSLLMGFPELGRHRRRGS